MRRLLTTLLALLVFFAVAARAQDDRPADAATLTFPDRPELFVTVEPAEEPVRVQRQIVLRIRLVSTARFESLSLTRPSGDAGMEIFELSPPRTREVRSYAADGFAHEVSYAIFPLRSGPMTMPAIRATGRVKGADGETVDFDLSTPGRTLEILAAPANWTESWWMIADAMEIEESWSIPPERLRRGDVVRRTVTVSARGAPADRMAPPEHGAARGVEVHEAGLESRTIRSATGFTGVVTRSWDIVIADAPVVHIPPVRVAFWDAAADAPGLRAAPARRIEPAEPDREARAAALIEAAASERRGAIMTALLGALLLAAPLIGIVAAFAWAALPTRADARLLSACRRAKGPKAALRAVEAWRRETGYAAAECEPARTLEAAVFGGRIECSHRAAALALLSSARQARRAALIRWLDSMLDTLLGRPVDLARGPRGAPLTNSLRLKRDSR